MLYVLGSLIHAVLKASVLLYAEFVHTKHLSDRKGGPDELLGRLAGR